MRAMTARLFGRWLLRGCAIVALLFTESRLAYAEDSPVEGQRGPERAPAYALWTGARFGIFIPYGALYTDRALVTTPFEDVATSGPAMELDVGARFARRFVAYAFLEQTFLGTGRSSAWTAPHGGQSAPSTEALGAGLRWESNPDGLGIVADVAVAERWFTVHWADGTTLRMSGPADVHVGLGASWRIVQRLTLSPMMSVFSGAFSKRALDGQTLGESAGSYSAIALTLSSHVDID